MAIDDSELAGLSEAERAALAEKARTEAEMTREGGEDAIRMLAEQVRI